MKAITVSQPHADQILDGSKIIENRGWWTDYRGPLLIHSGRRGEPQRARGALGLVLLTSVHEAKRGCCALAGGLMPEQYEQYIADIPIGRSLCHFILGWPYRFAEPFPMTGRTMIYDIDRQHEKLVRESSRDWVGWK